MGENGIPTAGTFSERTADRRAWLGLPWRRPLQILTRSPALSGAYQMSPVKISRNFWGSISVERRPLILLEAHHTTGDCVFGRPRCGMRPHCTMMDDFVTECLLTYLDLQYRNLLFLQVSISPSCEGVNRRGIIIS